MTVIAKDSDPQSKAGEELSPSGRALGAYEIVGLIGQGGMSRVFAARHRLTGEMRALKVLRRDLGRDRAYVERFAREVKLAAAIQHENLVRVMEPGMENSLVFLPMELLHGETLAHFLGRCGRLNPADATAILFGLIRGVHAMHQRGVVHRDLKPSNVFLAVDECGQITPKVLDFGTASDITGDGERTGTGVVLGTPFYMALEQAVGLRDIDARADVYALGVIAYQMLTGARPYESDERGFALMKLIANASYQDVRACNPDLSEAIATCVRRALAREREQRFESVVEFAAALKAAVALTARDAGAAAGTSDVFLNATLLEGHRDSTPLRVDTSQLIESLEATCTLSVQPMETTLASIDRTIVLEGLHDSAVFDVFDAPAVHVRRWSADMASPQTPRAGGRVHGSGAAVAASMVAFALATLAVGVVLGTLCSPPSLHVHQQPPKAQPAASPATGQPKPAEPARNPATPPGKIAIPEVTSKPALRSTRMLAPAKRQVDRGSATRAKAAAFERVSCGRGTTRPCL